MLVENYHQFPSALNFGSLPQFFAPSRGQQRRKLACKRKHLQAMPKFCGVFDSPSPLLFASAIRSIRVSASLFLNLPGWRWGTITQIPLVAVSRPLHSGVCETRQDAGLPVLHSEISDSGLLRTRGGQQREEARAHEIVRSLRAQIQFLIATKNAWCARLSKTILVKNPAPLEEDTS